MNLFRSTTGLFLVLENTLTGFKVIAGGSNDLSFTTQAMRLLMFCTRYFDRYLVQDVPFMRVFLLLSALVVVVLLGYDKWSQCAHRNVTSGTIREVTAILLFPAVLGAHFMYAPTISEFLWSFSRFIDVVLEIPQLKRVFVSEKLDMWIIAYYCCIGSHVFLCAVNLVYRDKGGYVFDVIVPSTTISKGFVIAAFFVARLFNQHGRRSAGDHEGNRP